MASEKSRPLTVSEYGSVGEYGSTSDYGTVNASAMETGEYGSASVSEYGSAPPGVSEYGSATTGVPGSTGVSEYGSATTGVPGSTGVYEYGSTALADDSTKTSATNVCSKHSLSGEYLPYVAPSGSSDSEEEEDKIVKDEKKKSKSRSCSPEHRKSKSRSSSASSASSRSRSPSQKKESNAKAPSVSSGPTSPVKPSSSKPFTFGRSHASRSRSRSRSSQSRSRSRSRDRRKRRRSRDRRRRSPSRSRSRGNRRRRHNSRDRHRRRRRRRHSRSKSHERRRSRDRKPNRNRERRRSRDSKRASRPDEQNKITYKEHLKQTLLIAQRELERTGKLDLSSEANKNLGHYLAVRGEKPSKLPIYEDPMLAVTGGLTLDDKVSPQVAFIQSMQDMQKKAQELTGVSVPKYYNPAAVNPMKYAEQVQKRKLLWSKGKEEKTETKPAPSWQAAAKVLEKEVDGKASEKFKKLMGIKAGSVDAGGQGEEPVTDEMTKKQNELFEHLDKEYEFARMTTHTHKGIGLGFNSHYQAFIEAQQAKPPVPE